MTLARDEPGDALHAEVRRTVEQAIIDVVGRDFYDEFEVGPDSTFAEDLEIESMELSEIADRLMEAYEGKVDFLSWFEAMDLEELVQVTVGDLVDFIATSVARSDPERASAIG